MSILASLAIASIGYFYYLDLQKNIRQKKEIDLSSIAQLKINELTQWVNERTADIQFLSQSPFFIETTEKWLKEEDREQAETYLIDQIKLSKKQSHYQSIFMVSLEAKILLSDESGHPHFDSTLVELIHKSIKQDKNTLTGFYYCSTEQKIHFDILSPIKNQQQQIIAVLIFRVEPLNYLYPFIQSWPTPSKTSETLLIKKESDHVLFLNELRHQSGTALNLKISLNQKTLPAVMVAEGATGIISGIDYRGKKVMAYVAPVPSTDWFMVTKVDQDELFHELVAQNTLIFVLTFLIILLLSIAIAFYYNLRQKKIYRSLWQTEEEFKTTLYSIGDAVITTNDKGRVKHLNKIAEELTGWTEKEAENKELAQIFNIINETTGETTENPVTKVLKDGVIVGLANHTMLISKQGVKIPIADSAAPIRSSNREIVGVVLVFRDQSEERNYIDEIKISRDFAESIIETLHESLLVLDANLKVISANQMFYDSFHCTTDETIGQSFFEMNDQFWNNHKLRQQLETILPQNTSFNNFEFQSQLRGSEKQVLNMNARRIKFKDQKTKSILLAINDVTEKSRLIKELLVAKEKAEESNKLKSAFLANMSHEIRTPLNGILGFSSLLGETSLSQKKRINYINIIENNGQQLLSVVNDILDISLIQSNQVKIKKQDFELRAFIEEIYTFYATLKVENLRSIELIAEYNSQRQDLVITSDKDRLFQIFKNLMDNAFKFTHAGYIRFGAVPSEKNVTFFVKDTGRGIPKDKAQSIFEKFEQIELSNKGTTDGNGLGLSIAKGFVERLGGKIWVESEPKKGAKFYFRIPLN